MGLWRDRLFSGLDVSACILQGNVPLETSNISFETENKQQYATKTTCTEAKKKRKGGGGEGSCGDQK